MLLCQLAKHLNVYLPLCTHLIITDFYVLTCLKAFCIGMDLNMYLSTLAKSYMSLNELLLESERSEMKRYVLGHLIQPISWRGLILAVIPLMYLSSLHLDNSKGGRY